MTALCVTFRYYRFADSQPIIIDGLFTKVERRTRQTGIILPERDISA